MNTPIAASAWPPLPLAQWRDTFATLHMWTQIVGKTRLALAPMENHWWQVALYVNERGLTTSAMPCGERTFAVELDFVAHALSLRASDGASHAFALTPQPVAVFYAQYLAALRSIGVQPVLMPSYDRNAAHRWWQTTVQADRVLKRFRDRFVGKQSPVHFFWGSFDLAATRFSGRPAPRHPGGAPNCPDRVMVEAYSHECSSCGFWPGGGVVDEAAFYAYAYPEPPGYPGHAVRPAAAYYHPQMHEFILPYSAVRAAVDPDTMLLEFLQSTYEAAAVLGRWDRAALERDCDNRRTMTES